MNTTPTAQTAPEGAQITPLPPLYTPYVLNGRIIESKAQAIFIAKAFVGMEDVAERIVTACNSHAALTASNAALRRALESIARAPAFDANTQSIVDLARRTLNKTQP